MVVFTPADIAARQQMGRNLNQIRQEEAFLTLQETNPNATQAEYQEASRAAGMAQRSDTVQTMRNGQIVTIGLDEGVKGVFAKDENGNLHQVQNPQPNMEYSIRNGKLYVTKKDYIGQPIEPLTQPKLSPNKAYLINEMATGTKPDLLGKGSVNEKPVTASYYEKILGGNVFTPIKPKQPVSAAEAEAAFAQRFSGNKTITVQQAVAAGNVAVLEAKYLPSNTGLAPFFAMQAQTGLEKSAAQESTKSNIQLLMQQQILQDKVDTGELSVAQATAMLDVYAQQLQGTAQQAVNAKAFELSENIPFETTGKFAVPILYGAPSDTTSFQMHAFPSTDLIEGAFGVTKNITEGTKAFTSTTDVYGMPVPTIALAGLMGVEATLKGMTYPVRYAVLPFFATEIGNLDTLTKSYYSGKTQTIEELQAEPSNLFLSGETTLTPLGQVVGAGIEFAPFGLSGGARKIAELALTGAVAKGTGLVTRKISGSATLGGISEFTMLLAPAIIEGLEKTIVKATNEKIKGIDIYPDIMSNTLQGSKKSTAESLFSGTAIVTVEKNILNIEKLAGLNIFKKEVPLFIRTQSIKVVPFEGTEVGILYGSKTNMALDLYAARQATEIAGKIEQTKNLFVTKTTSQVSLLTEQGINFPLKEIVISETGKPLLQQTIDLAQKQSFVRWGSLRGYSFVPKKVTDYVARYTDTSKAFVGRGEIDFGAVQTEIFDTSTGVFSGKRQVYKIVGDFKERYAAFSTGTNLAIKSSAEFTGMLVKQGTERLAFFGEEVVAGLEDALRIKIYPKVVTRFGSAENVAKSIEGTERESNKVAFEKLIKGQQKAEEAVLASAKLKEEGHKGFSLNMPDTVVKQKVKEAEPLLVEQTQKGFGVAVSIAEKQTVTNVTSGGVDTARLFGSFGKGGLFPKPKTPRQVQQEALQEAMNYEEPIGIVTVATKMPLKEKMQPLTTQNANATLIRLGGIEKTGTKQASFAPTTMAERTKVIQIQLTSNLTKQAQKPAVKTLSVLSQKLLEQAKLKQISLTAELTKQAQKQDTETRSILLQASITKTLSRQAERTAEREATRTATRTITRTVLPRIVKPKIPWGGKLPKNKRPSEMNMPEELTGTGFDVFVKSKGKLKKVSRTPLTARAAYALGQRLTDVTAARSFTVLPSQTVGAPQEADLPTFNPERYYTSKRTGLFVEKPKYSISTHGEKVEITYKGIAANKAPAWLKSTKKVLRGF